MHTYHVVVGAVIHCPMLLLKINKAKEQNQSGRRLLARINIFMPLSQDVLGVILTGINQNKRKRLDPAVTRNCPRVFLYDVECIAGCTKGMSNLFQSS